MPLPEVDIQFGNGNLQQVVPSADGVFGLLASATAVAGKFELNKPYMLKGMKDVAELGIMPDVENYKLYRALQEFYTEAGEGTELWLMGFDKSVKLDDWFKPGQAGTAPAEAILNKANGKISMLFTDYNPSGSFNVSNGLAEEVIAAKNAAQSFAESYLQKKKSPVFVILEGFGYTGNVTDLPDLHQGSDNRVGIFIGDTLKHSGTPENNGSANHILAGRLAKIKVQENPGKVKLGHLETETAFILDTPVEDADVESLHDKGYITFRTHVRKPGYYITDDPLATSVDDDYSHITNRRVIDKAYRIAYEIASDEILNDVDLLPEGTLDPLYASSVETEVENAIKQQMTDRGELSKNKADDNDIGVIAKFDLTNNVASTSTIKMKLKVRPKGYARWFVIELGFDINQN